MIMGYSYDRHGRLSCDVCGAADGQTRRRTCPYKVIYSEGSGIQFGANPRTLPYCSAPALCPACFTARRATLHADCKAGAARSTAEEHAKGERLKAGGYYLRTAWGDWYATVPPGMVGVRFESLSDEAYRLIPATEYNDPAGTRKLWLDEYTEAYIWTDHPGSTSKRIA